MRKIIFVLLIASVVALFIIPESLIGDYKGLLKIKYLLRDTAIKMKNIVFSFAKTGEKPKELNDIQKKLQDQAEQKVKDAAKDAAKDVINGL